MNIKSFTEKAFLSDFYLKNLYPSNCKEISIPFEVGDTALDIAAHPSIDFYTNPAVRVHWAPKIGRGVARLVYGIAVLTFFSPVGAIYNGVHYYIETDQNKTAAYAKAFFKDLIAFGVGVACIGLSVLTVVTLSSPSSFHDVFFSVLAGFGVLFFSGATKTDEFLQRVCAEEDQMQGMLISLSLYNQYGAVGNQGALLPYPLKKNLAFQNNQWVNAEPFDSLLRDAQKAYFTSVIALGLHNPGKEILADREYIRLVEKENSSGDGLKKIKTQWEKILFIHDLTTKCKRLAPNLGPKPNLTLARATFNFVCALAGFSSFGAEADPKNKIDLRYKDVASDLLPELLPH